MEKERKRGKPLVFYRSDSNNTAFLNNFGLKVELNKFKEIILEEETGIELGGMKKKSFSIVFPMEEVQLIETGKISLDRKSQRLN